MLGERIGYANFELFCLFESCIAFQCDQTSTCQCDQTITCMGRYLYKANMENGFSLTGYKWSGWAWSRW